MIKSIQFKNFKALRDATLPLSRFTLILGPNGSGKSTAMQALSMFSHPNTNDFEKVVTADYQSRDNTTVSVAVTWSLDERESESSRKKIKNSRIVHLPEPSNLSATFVTLWMRRNPQFLCEGPVYQSEGVELPPETQWEIHKKIESFRVFSFEAQALSEPAQIRPGLEVAANGSRLAGVLDGLLGAEPERYEALSAELKRWLPEFDRILLEPSDTGTKTLLLRTRDGQHRIPASNLSHGTLFALGFLTLAYLPNPPSIICFEEPERGIHPRLLRDIRDSMYRLCYPEEFQDKREPVQVIATTHSPYMLDLYKDYPEEIVIAHKDAQGIRFERLADKVDYDEFLQNAPLGEVWYSGILGGVPVER